MNQNNFDYLKDGIKFLGFKDTLNELLLEKIKSAAKDFQLHVSQEYGTQKVDYILDFKKSEKSDMYFFNKYNASMEKGTENVSQNFYITKNHGITAKEAFNLLSGRAVNKDLVNAEKQPYNAWLQLSFGEKDNNGNFKLRQYTSGYGYDLEKVLAEHPIKELTDPEQKQKLLKSLERGNVHQVTFEKDGSTEVKFVQANPQFKNLIIYDKEMKKQFTANEKKSVPTETSKTESLQGRSTVKSSIAEGSKKEMTEKKKKGMAI